MTATPRTRRKATQESTVAVDILMTPSKMKVVELREALQSRGLSPKGLKKDLIGRLERALRGTSPTPLSRQLTTEPEIDLEDKDKMEAPLTRGFAEEASLELQGHDSGVQANSSAAEPNELICGPAVEETVTTAFQQPQALSTSPLQHPAPTTSPAVVHISNFVRPFTIPAVKDLVGQFGQVLDFWMDALKSHCFVQYASREAAADCHRHLDGLRWPLDCGRLLSATDSSLEAMQTARRMEDRPAASPKETIPSQPVLVLDKFFRKTYASPALYYLPAHPLAQ